MSYFLHLRLAFQFLLSPIFLWGYLLGSGKPDIRLLIAYLAFHLFGYAGGTALNSSYDHDEGPIGGMEHPPPVPRHLLAFSIIWQVVGFVLARAVSIEVAAIYALMFVLSLAYSHPRTRWKGRPLMALATVALGQGVLAFAAGWSTATGAIISDPRETEIVGGMAAVLLIVGLYPLTQVYQLEEDTRRGDMTFARFLGVDGSFRWAQLCIAFGGAAAAWVIGARYSTVEGLVLLLLVAILIAWIQAWHSRFVRSTDSQNYRTLMRIYAATSIPFLAWITLHLRLN